MKKEKFVAAKNLISSFSIHRSNTVTECCYTYNGIYYTCRAFFEGLLALLVSKDPIITLYPSTFLKNLSVKTAEQTMCNIRDQSGE